MSDNISIENPLELQALFHSEISSSFLLHRLLKKYPAIATAFVERFAGVPDGFQLEDVIREKPYPRQGVIDLLIIGSVGETNYQILIEVKVHDYLSATSGQIETYYTAAENANPNSEIIFIYLTQFSKCGTDTAEPGTIAEYKRAVSALPKAKEKIKHIGWSEVHDVLGGFDTIDSNDRLMLYLQREWILAKCKLDDKENRHSLGERQLSDYLEDMADFIKTKLPAGETFNLKNRSVNVIQLIPGSNQKLLAVYDFIITLGGSTSLATLTRKESENTLEAARNFLQEIAKDQTSWGLAGFYGLIFSFVIGSHKLVLYGKGITGFSIKGKSIRRGEFSLCTLHVQRHQIEIALQR